MVIIFIQITIIVTDNITHSFSTVMLYDALLLTVKLINAKYTW